MRFRLVTGSLAVCLLLSSPLLAQTQTPPAGNNDTVTLPPLQIIGVTPMPGSGVDIDKVPSNVQTLGAGDLRRDGEDDLVPMAAARRLSDVNLNNEQGNQFQPDFVYRGFEASPISGVPEGIAVYQNGVRINEAFGDNVNWDLVPQFAVNQMTVQGNNPVFGLNALGGAVTLDMKNGFNFHGTNVELSGGSYGNLTGYGETGMQFGNFGFYAGVSGLHDDGFRWDSPTALRQGYLDLGWERDKVTLHLTVSAADNDINGTGPTPIQMLDQNPKSFFTIPQAISNEAELLQLAGTYQVTDSLLLSADVHYRHFVQHLIDGNTTDVQACTNNAAFLCLEGNNLYPNDVLYNQNGKQVSSSVLPPDATPGEIDFSTTRTNTVGGTFQATSTNPIFSHPNNLTVGFSIDHSDTKYGAYGELGTLTNGLQVIGSGVIIDQGLSPTASPPIEEPVSVESTNTSYGIYATDTFDITPRLSATLSGRFNLVQVALNDLVGTSLNSNNSFSHFNPGIGLTYKISDQLTAYAGFSESNRAPTAGELSCANPKSPCLLDAFLVADPPLKQVISQTYEAGLRGHFTTAVIPGQFGWNASLYRTDSLDDITLLATQVNGFGFFANSGTTRRQGVEASLHYDWEKWRVQANYTFLDATYLDSLTLASNSPAANANGNIHVRSGDTIPMMPAHRITFGIEYAATEHWKIGADLRFVSSQYLVGDESNQEPQMKPYTTVNLHSSYKLASWATVFGEVDNLFNANYYTYGTFTDFGGLPPNIHLNDPRTFSPSPGVTFFGGMRLSF